VADYSGDSNYNTASSSALTQTVDKATPSVSLASSLNPSVFGSSVTFTATVPTDATGTVIFMDGGTTLGTGTIAKGTASYSTAALGGGTHSITAVYSGDSNYVSATSAALSQVVHLQTVTVGLTSSSNPAYAQEPVTFTATVPAGATGTVTFKDGTTTLGTGTAASGSATYTTSDLAPGTHSITAIYGGDSNFAGATSTALSQVIDDTATISQISVAPGTTEPVGTNMTFSALVSTYGDTPTGSVTFANGATTLGSGTLSSVSTTNLLPYSNALDSTHWTAEQANVAAPTISTSSVKGPNGSANAAVQVAYPSTSATGQGGADFAGLTTTISSAALAGKTGTFSIWAESSTSATITLYMADSTSGTAVASNTCTIGSTWTRCFVTGTFPATSTGAQVSIRNWGAAAETVNLWGAQLEQASTPGPYVQTSGTQRTGTGAVATFSTSTLLAGTYNVTAAYGGDSNYKPSTSASERVTITQAGSSVALTSSKNPSTYGGSVTFTATVTGPETTPTGTVTFKDGGTTIGTGTLNSSGVATLTTATLTGGSHSITAVYSGDTNFNGSTSTAVTQVVDKADGSIAATSSPNPSVYDQTVTFTITVSGVTGGATPTGTVTIKDASGNTVGTGTLNSEGVATITSSSLTAGTHKLTVSYSGDGNYSGS
jgi:hypothetical protein